jgi:hypothetical protein
MKRAMVLSTITVLACLTVTTAVDALPATQEGQQMSRLIDANDPEAMRSLLLAWLRTAEMVHGIEPRGSREIESMSPEVMAELLRQIPERERFAEALVRETASLEAALARGAPASRA